MIRQVSPIALMAIVLWSCGGGDAADESVPAAELQTAASEAAAAESGGFDRESFSLCPALEPHRDELASIVGFVEKDPARELAVFDSECIVHGDHGAFARVSLAPAFTRSIQMHIGGFDAESSAAPELGPDAMFVDGRLQPHVVFSMGKLIIDVDAENIETPSRETMIELATRVREILTEANS